MDMATLLQIETDTSGKRGYTFQKKCKPLDSTAKQPRHFDRLQVGIAHVYRQDLTTGSYDSILRRDLTTVSYDGILPVAPLRSTGPSMIGQSQREMGDALPAQQPWLRQSA